MKIITIVGARPQFIKAATVSRAFAEQPDISEIIVHTGQHYDADMSDVFFDQMDIPKPHYHLAVGSDSHGRQTGAMMSAIDEVFEKENPTAVLVYGDTNSTLAGALCAAKMHIPVAHVEAGLRSFNRNMPEEINRVLTDHVSDVLFVPTASATENLEKEGIIGQKVVQVGDVMLDASLYYREQSTIELGAIAEGVSKEQYILATIHRAENTDHQERLTAIIDGLGQAAAQSKFPVVLPLHPRTKAALEKFELMTRANDLLQIISPLGFLEMLQLEADAALIATDSGGVQKEAYFFRKPCVTLRDETEWVELVESGWNSLVPPNTAETVAQNITGKLGSAGKDIELYGSGQAARQIVQDIAQRYF